MPIDITYCSNCYPCKLKDKCKRSDHPKEIKYVWFSKFYNELKVECEHFMERNKFDK